MMRGMGKSKWMGGVICLAGALCLAGAVRVAAGNDVAELTRGRRAAGVYAQELSRAWALFDRAEIRDARDLFSDVAESADATEEDRVQALMGLGWCGRFGRPRPDRNLALHSFTELIERHPDHPAAPWALIELGILHTRKERSGGATARPFFQQVLDEYPDSPAIHEALLRLAGTWFYDIDDEYSARGFRHLERHIEEHPGNPLAIIMHFRLAHWSFEVFQDYSRGLPHSRYVAREGMSDPSRWPFINWQVAEVYRLRLGQPDKAIPFYARIILDSPRSMHVLGAKKRIEELTGRSWEEVVAEHREPGDSP